MNETKTEVEALAAEVRRLQAKLKAAEKVIKAAKAHMVEWEGGGSTLRKLTRDDDAWSILYDALADYEAYQIKQI